MGLYTELWCFLHPGGCSENWVKGVPFTKFTYLFMGK